MKNARKLRKEVGAEGMQVEKSPVYPKFVKHTMKFVEVTRRLISKNIISQITFK